MAHEIWVEQISGGTKTLVELPENFSSDPYVLADEMRRICQKAYEMGRMDEIEAVQELIRSRKRAMTLRKRDNPSGGL
jgi:hypothetical protein